MNERIDSRGHHSVRVRPGAYVVHRNSDGLLVAQIYRRTTKGPVPRFRLLGARSGVDAGAFPAEMHDTEHGSVVDALEALNVATESKLAISFEELNRLESETRTAWIVHVDACPDCRRSPFACNPGLLLQLTWNRAWAAAKKAWEAIPKEQRPDIT